MSAYHRCAAVLERELGVDPDLATRQALQRLLAPVDVAAQPEPPRPGRLGSATAELVGRAPELRRLQEVWRRAAAGRPGLVVVRGDAGVGKTRLVAEFADRVRRRGAVVASAQCFGASSGRLALAPVADWLRNPAVVAATATLEPVWRCEVERLVPTSGEARPPETGAAPADAWQRHRFFEGVARAVLGLGRPTLLVLDNLQWADSETRAFIVFCLGLVPDASVLVAATYRPSYPAPDPERDDWLEPVRTAGMLTDLDLSPLDLPDTARLVEAVSGRSPSRRDTELLQATTGGYPLHLVEAVRAVLELGRTLIPDGDLQTVLRDRLAQLSSPGREVAGLAAAVGRDFTLDLLTEASGLEAVAVARAVDELWRRRIVQQAGEGYDFCHELLRDAAYAQVGPPQRWLLHRRIAQGLELLHGADTDPVAAALAEQYTRGGRPQRALPYYRRAAEIAASRFAHVEAIRLHREALAIIAGLPEGPERDRDELAVLEVIAAPLTAHVGYASPELREVHERSIELAESLGSREATLGGLLGLWTSQFVRGQIAAAYRTVQRARALVDPASEHSVAIHFGIAGTAVSLGRPAEALRHFELAGAGRDAYALSVGTRTDVHGRAWAAHAYWLRGDDEQARISAEDAIALARELGHPYSLAVALGYAAITQQLRGDPVALRETLEELGALCERRGYAYYREWVLILDGWCGSGASGIGLARRGIANLEAAGSLARMPFWRSLLAELTARQGRHGAARAILDAALDDGRARSDVWWVPEVMRMRAAYDPAGSAVARLRSAAGMAAAHGSAALFARCEADLAELGARPQQ